MKQLNDSALGDSDAALRWQSPGARAREFPDSQPSPASSTVTFGFVRHESLAASCSKIELDLSRFAGRRLIEMFGQSRFPVIGTVPYPLTVAPHSFYWFAIESEVAATAAGATADTEQEKINLPDGWEDLAAGRTKKSFAAIARRSSHESVPGSTAKAGRSRNVQRSSR